MSNAENNRRIAKNTALLYVRMIISLGISLIMARVVLRALGAEDYGIYNVVAGVVVMFSFLNASMSGATSRFLNYEMGRGDIIRLKETFSTALIVHIGIAIVILIVAETVGLWFVTNKLVIPPERMEVAKWIYQFSILSMMATVTQVPYNACIIANERMSVYAYVEILNSALRLGIAYLIMLSDRLDRLWLYGFLVLLVSVAIALIYRVYCIRKFPESRFRWVWRPDIIRPMLSFSGWDLYGNMSVMLRTQGVSMLINMFFGPLLNAATGIATAVQNAVMALANNLVTAARPQIVKNYAQGDYASLLRLQEGVIKLSFLLISLLTVPLICEIHYVLQLWLGEVPPYTAVFCVYTLLFNVYANMSTLLVCSLHAAGRIKRPSMINGTLYLLVVPVSYVAYCLGMDSWLAYLFNVLAGVLGMLSNAWTNKMYIPGFSFRHFFLRVFLPSLFILGIAACCVSAIQRYVPQESFGRLCLSALISSVLLILLCGMGLFTVSQRKYALNIIKNKICRKL